MTKIFLKLLILTSILSSCASKIVDGPTKKITMVPVETPSEWVDVNYSRFPSSVISNSKDNIIDWYSTPYSQIVNKIINDVKSDTSQNDHNSQKALGRYLEAVSHVYLSSEQLLEELDQNLKTKKIKSSIFENYSYQQVLKNWMIRERLENQIHFVILNLLNMESDLSNNNSDIAKKVLNYTRRIWTDIAHSTGPTPKIILENKIRKLVFQELFTDLSYKLKNHISVYKIQNPRSEVPQNFLITQNIVNDLLMTDAEEAAAVKNLKNEIQLAAKQNSATTEWLSIVRREINIEETNVMKKDVRTPQSEAAICPGTDTNGNISGSHFPKGTWAITLDDGPHKTHTEVIKKAFDDNQIKGSFFWLAQLTNSYPNIVKMIKDDGNTLATHSFSHANLPTLNNEGLNKEIIMANQRNEKAFEFKPRFFRCPYGACGKPDGKIRKMIADEGQVHVFWNIDSLDWQDKDSDSIVRRVIGQFDSISKSSGGVILFHDIHPQSAAAITKLIPLLIKKGAHFETIENIVANHNEAIGTSCPNDWSPHATK
jgi:peptidoglycan/xylan/chitin deacetylase (PgdA/CDA1 family)